MNKSIIIINGSGGVGKDTFCEMVDKVSGYQCDIYSSVQFVKELAKECGWNGAKEEKDRKFLSDLKDLLTEYNDLPFKKVCEEIDSFLDCENTILLFIHIREPKEIQRVVDRYGSIVKTLLIENPNVKQVVGNHADEEVNSYSYDLYISNDGTLDDLRQCAEHFYYELKQGNI